MDYCKYHPDRNAVRWVQIGRTLDVPVCAQCSNRIGIPREIKTTKGIITADGRNKRIDKNIVEKVAKENKSPAKRGGFHFDSLVMQAHWDHCIIEFGLDIQNRVFHLWGLFHPEHFNEDGHIKSYNNQMYWIETRLNEICKRIMTKRINSKPEYSLDNWGDLARKTVDPQRKT